MLSMHWDTAFFLAYAAVRILAGLLFFFQGFDKIFRIGFTRTSQAVAAEYAGVNIPSGLIKVSVFLSSLIEFVGGILLILGAGTFEVLVVMLVHMLLVAGAFSIREAVWSNGAYWPRFAMLVFLLMFLMLNEYSLDQWLF